MNKHSIKRTKSRRAAIGHLTHSSNHYAKSIGYELYTNALYPLYCKARATYVNLHHVFQIHTFVHLRHEADL